MPRRPGMPDRAAPFVANFLVVAVLAPDRRGADLPRARLPAARALRPVDGHPARRPPLRPRARPGRGASDPGGVRRRARIRTHAHRKRLPGDDRALRLQQPRLDRRRRDIARICACSPNVAIHAQDRADQRPRARRLGEVGARRVDGRDHPGHAHLGRRAADRHVHAHPGTASPTTGSSATEPRATAQPSSTRTRRPAGTRRSSPAELRRRDDRPGLGGHHRLRALPAGAQTPVGFGKPAVFSGALVPADGARADPAAAERQDGRARADEQPRSLPAQDPRARAGNVPGALRAGRVQHPRRPRTAAPDARASRARRWSEARLRSSPGSSPPRPAACTSSSAGGTRRSSTGAPRARRASA